MRFWGSMTKGPLDICLWPDLETRFLVLPMVLFGCFYVSGFVL